MKLCINCRTLLAIGWQLAGADSVLIPRGCSIGGCRLAWDVDRMEMIMRGVLVVHHPPHPSSLNHDACDLTVPSKCGTCGNAAPHAFLQPLMRGSNTWQSRRTSNIPNPTNRP